MENPTWHKIHPAFQLNKASYSVGGLEKFAEELVEEGQPFQKSIGEFLLDWTSQKNINRY